MVKKTDNGTNLAPFLSKLYDMVDDQSTDATISWSQSSESFVIWDVTEFSRDLLPKYFKHSNFSSFMRQLNIYGFRKVDTDRWEFGNEGFIKGQQHLLANIRRRKNPPGAVQQKSSQVNSSQPVDESKEVDDHSRLQNEVETLKIHKNALMQELVKLRERQASSQNKLLVLRERIQGMEKSQQQMLAFIAMVAQSPGFLVQICQQKDGNWRVTEAGKITPLRQGHEDDQALSADSMIVKYQQSLPDEAHTDLLAPLDEAEKSMEHDNLFDGAKEFFMNIDFPAVENGDNLHVLENHGQLVLPEFDLSLLEQYLLSSPNREDCEDTESQEEVPDASGIDLDSVSCGIEFGKPLTENDGFSCPDASNGHGDLELLTEQLGHLYPGKTSEEEMT